MREGGHAIEIHEIVRRWHAVQVNLQKTSSHFDSIILLDNSAHEPVIVARRLGHSVTLAPSAPAWARLLLQKPPVPRKTPEIT